MSLSVCANTIVKINADDQGSINEVEFNGDNHGVVKDNVCDKDNIIMVVCNDDNHEVVNNINNVKCEVDNHEVVDIDANDKDSINELECNDNNHEIFWHKHEIVCVVHDDGTKHIKFVDSNRESIMDIDEKCNETGNDNGFDANESIGNTEVDYGNHDVMIDDSISID